MMEQFQKISPMYKAAGDKGDAQQQRQIREAMLLNQQYKGVAFLQDTMLDEEWLRILAQVERVQKGAFEGPLNLEDLQGAQLAELYRGRRTPIQIAETLKPVIGRQVRLSEDRKRKDGIEEEREDGSVPGRAIKGYWDLISYKL